MNALQQTTLARGMAAQIDRDKRRRLTYLAIMHPDTIDPVNIRAKLVQYLPDSCTMKVDQAAEQLLSELVETRSLVEEQAGQIEELRAQLRLSKVAAPEQPADPRWIGIREAAQILGKSYATVYRAVHDGRITARETRVRKHSGWEVLPDSFRPKQTTTKH